MKIQNLNKRAMLVILDGFGVNTKDNKNAILHAKKPNIDYLFSHYPMTTIEPGGILVGLPKGVAGNSEVGHMNLGAGKPVRQDLVRINEAIEQNTLSDMKELKNLIAYAKSHSNRIHLMGLLSDGGVHSHIAHIKELVKILAKEKIELFLHAFMDGRDTAKDVGGNYLDEIGKIDEIKIASIGGRSIGMDRDRRWNKIEHAYKTFIGEGLNKFDLAPRIYLEDEYSAGRFDEFIEPALFIKEGAIKNDDAVFFFNFRPDRAIQMSHCLADPKFREFQTPVKPGYYLCMTPYIQDDVDLPILFDKEKVPGTFSEYLSKLGKKQFKIAETEKYAHVTFFFNGGERKAFPGETQILVPSPKEVATYDQKPEMSAFKVLGKLEAALEDHSYDFYLVNFANSDMVGHTGNYEAAIKAIEVLDECIGRLMEKCRKEKVTMCVTADHGNADQMCHEDGSAHTSHTEAPVPFVVFDDRLKDAKLNSNGSNLALKDVSPTMLYIMGIPMNPEFTGVPIFE